MRVFEQPCPRRDDRFAELLVARRYITLELLNTRPVIRLVNELH